MGKVFIVQDDGRRDYSDARRFGEPNALIERDVFPDDAQIRMDEILSIMRTKLAEFNPACDCLLLSGDPLAMVAATMVLTLSTGRIRCLKYDKETRRYFPVVVET